MIPLTDFLEWHTIEHTFYYENVKKGDILVEILKQNKYWVPKKNNCIALPFRGKRSASDRLSEEHSLQQTSVLFSQTPLYYPLGARLATSMHIYKFACSCMADYVGRTTPCLTKLINEHHRTWLEKGATRSITRSHS